MDGKGRKRMKGSGRNRRDADMSEHPKVAKGSEGHLKYAKNVKNVKTLKNAVGQPKVGNET